MAKPLENISKCYHHFIDGHNGSRTVGIGLVFQDELNKWDEYQATKAEAAVILVDQLTRDFILEALNPATGGTVRKWREKIIILCNFCREKEMEDLKRLHEETKAARQEKEKQKVDKKTAMKNRLKKVRDRKRLKMGLTVLENGSGGDDDDDDESKKTEELEKEKQSQEEFILQRLKEFRDKEDEARRKAIIRDWDVGKKVDKTSSSSTASILTSKPAEAKVLSQEEWVSMKRSGVNAQKLFSSSMSARQNNLVFILAKFFTLDFITSLAGANLS